MEKKHDPTRRGLLRKAAYAAPVVLALQATSAVAKAGSEKGAPEAQETKEAPTGLSSTADSPAMRRAFYQNCTAGGADLRKVKYRPSRSNLLVSRSQKRPPTDAAVVSRGHSI